VTEPQPQSSPALSGPASELRLRIISAIVMGIVALVTLVWGGVSFAVIWTGVSLAVFSEWITMSHVAARALRLAIGLLALALLGYALWLGRHDWASFVFLIGAILQLVPGKTLDDRLWSVAGFVYAAVLLIAVIVVRSEPFIGLAAIAWMFAVVWTTDIVAYFTGRALGGPKLWPRVSPKKTWSGFWGGLIAGTLAGVMVSEVAQMWNVPAPIGLLGIIMLSAAASILGQGGDLAESAMKRHFAVKDSGSLIPGHGGFMDRIDAFWAVAVLGFFALLARSLVT
jgi:phosphatidate cytidylyltransferase